MEVVNSICPSGYKLDVYSVAMSSIECDILHLVYLYLARPSDLPKYHIDLSNILLDWTVTHPVNMAIVHPLCALCEIFCMQTSYIDAEAYFNVNMYIFFPGSWQYDTSLRL